MSSRTAHSKTHRFIEVLALLTLVVPMFSPISTLPGMPAEPFLVLLGTVALVVLLGLVYRPLRHLGWVALLVAGLASLVLRSASVEGTLLVLFGAFLVFDSGWPGRFTIPAAAVLASLVVAQVTACLVQQEAFLRELARWVVSDGLLAVLVVTFRKDLFTKGEDQRPCLCLSEFDLAPRETQILHLVWGGLTAKEVAVELTLGDGTVRTYLTQIYRKLKVSGAKELMLLPHTHQIVFPEEPGEPGELNSRKRETVEG